MTAPADPPTVQVDVVSDVICPWCLIGKRRLEAAAELGRARWRLAVVWRPFQLNPDMPAEGMDRQAYLEAKFGGPAGAREVYDRIAEAGREVGIAFRFDLIRRTPSTVDAHRLLALAARQGLQGAAKEALMRAYFLDGRDLTDRAELAAIAGEAGVTGAADHLAGDADRAEVLAFDAWARQAGISGVPTFILAGRLAVPGAAHERRLAAAIDQAVADAG